MADLVAAPGLCCLHPEPRVRCGGRSVQVRADAACNSPSRPAAREQRVTGHIRGGTKLENGARLHGNGSGGTHRSSWLMESWRMRWTPRHAAAFSRRLRSSARGRRRTPTLSMRLQILASQSRSNGFEGPQGWTAF
jgi:hypothetical protein